MLDLVAAALRRIFELHRSFPRKLFELSIQLSMVALLFGGVMAAAVVYISWSLGSVPAHLNRADVMDLFYYWFYLNGVELVTSFVLLTYGLIAVRMRQLGELAMTERSFNEIWKGLTPNNWSAFFMAWLILFVVDLLLFKPLFDHDRSGWGYFLPTGFDDGLGTSKSARYLAWVNDMVILLRSYVPYILILYLLLADRRTALTIPTLKALAPVIGAIVILAFVINSLLASITHLLNTYILPPLIIPFSGSMIPLVFTYMIILIIMGLTLPGILLGMVGPLDAWENDPDRIARIQDTGLDQ